jgi:hypothetical protein
VALFEFLIIEVLARPTAEAKTVTPATEDVVIISDNTSIAVTKNLSLYNMVGDRRTAHAHSMLRRLSSAATAGLGVRDELALL